MKNELTDKLENKKSYREIKNIILVFSLLFMICAIVMGILYFVVDKQPFGTFGSICATIAIGLIPFFIHYNDAYLSVRERDSKIKDDTVVDLKHFSNILSDSRNAFVSSVLSSFNSYYKLERFKTNFLTQDRMQVVNSMENAILAINPNWQNQLYTCIQNCLYILPNDDVMNKAGATPTQQLDLFIDYLLFLLNELEIIAYNFINLRINKETYVREEQKILERRYFDSYFILVKVNCNKSYENIEIACDIMN